MGWARTLLLGDVGNRLDIEDTEKEITRLKEKQRLDVSKLKRNERLVLQMRDQLERQQLALTALTRFLITKNVISEDELGTFVDEVDALDGVIDGKLREPQGSK